MSTLQTPPLSARQATPEQAGLPRAKPEQLKGADPAFNAAALLALLEGKRDAYRDIVLMNAAAAFIVADRAENLAGGVALAANAIDSGLARTTLRKLVKVSNG